MLMRAESLAAESPEEAMALIVTYDYGNDNAKRANAYYAHALTQQQYGNLPLAVLSLNGAANALKNYDNPHLEGLVYSTIGDIYYQTHLFSNSYNAYDIAATLFEQSNERYKLHYALYNKGRSAFKLHRYGEAQSILNGVLTYSIEVDNREFTTLILNQLCSLYLYIKDETQLCNTVSMLDEYISPTDYNSHDYSLRAITSAISGDIDVATKFLNLAKRDNIPDTASIMRAEYYIYKCTGDNAKGIEILEQSTKLMEDMVVSSSKKDILNEEVELLKKYIANILYREQLEEKRDITHDIVLCIIITLLLMHVIGYRRKTRRDVQHYMDTINELQLIKDKSDSRLEPLASAIDRLYNDRLKDVNQLCEIYYEHSDTPRHATKVFEQVRQTIESIKSDEARLRELEELVDRCRDGLMSKLREECKKLNERELKVALYSYAGFSSRAICIFIDSNPMALSKMKYRIKSKIKEEECKSAEILIAGLE